MSDSLLKTIWENIKAILWAVVLALIVKTSVVEAYKVPSGSMENTIFAGDFLICNKFVYGAQIPLTDWRLPAFDEIEPGDVVVFRYPPNPDTNYIKRCIATPGQVIEIKDKVIYINGVISTESVNVKFTREIIPRKADGSASPDNFGPYRIPENYYFMMGDNRDNSFDSRFWGPVHRDLILGEAMIIHWSWADDPDSPEISPADPLSPPKLFLYNAVHFFERVRWGRLFKIIN
jgi:signal peptidase I